MLTPVFITLVIASVVLLIVWLRDYYQDHFEYWTKKGIRGLGGVLYFGSAAPVLLKRVSMQDFGLEHYMKFKNERFYGMFFGHTPILVLRDRTLIKQMLLKDGHIFINRGNIFVNCVGDKLFTNALFFLKDKKWKDIRSILSPTYTSSKMKYMFHFMNESTDRFLGHLNENLTKQPDESIDMEMKDLFVRIAHDIINTCMIGIDVDSLNDRDNDFITIAKRTTDLPFWRFFMVKNFPTLMGFLGQGIFPPDINSFYYDVVKNTIETRERNKMTRNDMMQLLIQARNGQLKYDETEKPVGEFLDQDVTTIREHEVQETFELSHEIIAAQIANFVFANLDTTSLILSHGCYELALDKTMQNRLRREISEKFKDNNSEFTYALLNEIPYLQMFVLETMRKYPAVHNLARSNNADYTITHPNNPKGSVVLEKGTIVHVPVYALHHDPEYFPNPDVFDPERFRDESKIPSGSYLPYGIGPRNCIGIRFGLMEVKLILVKLLLNFEVDVCGKTEVPLQWLKHPVKVGPANGVWLKIKSLK